MAPEPPPTQPYYERRVVLTSAATLLRRCRRGYLHHLVDSALTMPLHSRELRPGHHIALFFGISRFLAQPLSRFPPTFPHLMDTTSSNSAVSQKRNNRQ